MFTLVHHKLKDTFPYPNTYCKGGQQKTKVHDGYKSIKDITHM